MVIPRQKLEPSKVLTWAISGLSSHDVGNPYIVLYGINVNKLIYREQRDDKPDIALTGPVV